MSIPFWTAHSLFSGRGRINGELYHYVPFRYLCPAFSATFGEGRYCSIYFKSAAGSYSRGMQLWGEGIQKKWTQSHGNSPGSGNKNGPHLQSEPGWGDQGGGSVIYLDSAATSLLKPPGVKNAMIDAMLTMSRPGRGSHPWAQRAAAAVYDCRENLARLFNVDKTENVVFTFNATHSLNIAINSAVKKGSRVLVSGYEHNSVMRPLRAIGAEIRMIRGNLFQPEEFLNEAEKLLPWAEVVVCTHVSNAFGYILPVYALGRLCSESGKIFIVDASQSAGAMEVDFSAMKADFMAFPGHKGLMGPQGTGVLICKNEAKPLLYGGSGTDSLLPMMPDYLPDRLEAGTHNTAGIAALNEGVKFVIEKGPDNISRHEKKLLDVFVQGLKDREDVKLFYSDKPRVQSGLVSMIPEKMGCEFLAEELGKRGIAVRAGLHCAPLAHQSVGTIDTGTVRFSFSPFISTAQARTASHTLENILKKA